MLAFLLLVIGALLAVLLWRRGPDICELFFSGVGSMKPRRRKSARLACEQLSDRIAPAVTHTWTGAGRDSLASDAANWADNTAPAPGDSLWFGGNTPPATLDPALTNGLANIVIDASYTGVVTTATNVTLSGTLSQAASLLLIDPGQFTVGNVQLTGGMIQGSGDLEVTGSSGLPSVLGGDTIAVNTTFDSSASATINNDLTVNGSTITNVGGASWLQGKISLVNGAQIKNFGVMTVFAPNGELTSDGTATAVYNYGFWQVNSFVTIRAPFSNKTAADSPPASLSVNPGGSTKLYGGGTESAPFVVNPGAFLTVYQGTYQLQSGTSFVGSGQVEVTDADGVNGAQFVVAPMATVQVATSFRLSGVGQLSGGGNLNINGPFEWEGGSIKNLSSLTLGGNTQIIAGHTKSISGSNVMNMGNIIWTGGDDIQANTGTFYNYGTFDIQNDQSITPAAGGGVAMTFINGQYGQNGQYKGVVKKTAGTGITTFAVPFYNSGGDLLLNGLAMKFTAGFTQDNPNSTTDLGDGYLKVDPGVGGFLFKLDAGRLTGGGTLYGSLDFRGGTLDMGSDFGGLTITGNYDQTGGTLNLKIGPNQTDVLDVYGSASLANNSSTLEVTWTGAGNPSGTYYPFFYGAGLTGEFSQILPAGTWTANYQTELMSLSASPGNTMIIDNTTTLAGGDLTGYDSVEVAAGGTLLLEDGAAIDAPAGVQVDPGGTLIADSGTIDGDLSNAGTFDLGTLTLNGNYTQTGNAALDLNSGSFQVNSNFAEAGGSVLVGDGGTLTVTGDYLQLGGDLGLTGTGALNLTGTFGQSRGTTEVAGSATLTASTLPVGGIMTSEGGSVSAANGVEVLSGGLLLADAGTLSGGSDGVLVDFGGSLTASGGTLNGDLSNTGAVTASTLTVTGNYDQTAAATLNLSSGSVTVDGSFEEDGGSVVVGSGSMLSVDDGGTQAGGDLSLSGGMMNLGTGAFTQSGGTLEVASLSSLYAMTMTLGGSVTLEGGSVTAMTDAEVLSGGVLLLDGGTFSGDMGGVLVDASATLTAYSGTISGSLSNSGSVTLGAPNTPGTVTVTGGYTQTATGTLDATGGSLTVQGLFAEDGGSVVVGSGGTVTTSGWTQAGGDLALAGAVNDNGMFQQSGGTTEIADSATLSAFSVGVGGTLTLAGGTIAVGMGTVEVQSGSTLIMDSGTITGSMGGVQVDGGGTLTAYSGSIDGNLTNLGTVNLGDPTTAGTLAVSGNCLLSMGTLDAFLGGTAAGSSSQLDVGGQVTFGGTLAVSTINGFQPAPGNAFTLLSFGSASGTFATLDLPPLSTGTWNPVYDNVLDTFTLEVTTS
jgi:fibronectin-binding autotransporter adhesin